MIRYLPIVGALFFGYCLLVAIVYLGTQVVAKLSDGMTVRDGRVQGAYLPLSALILMVGTAAGVYLVFRLTADVSFVYPSFLLGGVVLAVITCYFQQRPAQTVALSALWIVGATIGVLGMMSLVAH